MTKKIEAPTAVAATRGAYFEQFGKSAWRGSYCVSWLGGYIVAGCVAIGRLLLQALVTAGGFCFGVILTIAAFCGLCWLISVIVGKGE